MITPPRAPHPAGSRSSLRRAAAVVRRARLLGEALEPRLLLTSTLYIDYGDGFAGGALNTTVGAIDNTTNGGNPNIDGPRLSDAAGNAYAAATGVVINAFGALYTGAAGATMRATMDAMVRRFYEAFDITVVDLTNAPQNVNGHSVRAATSLNDVSATLGINEGDTENNDSYVIVGQYLIGASNDNPATFATNGYGGISTVTDINSNNNNDGTALVLLLGTGDGATFNGPQIAHEAGHAFGLEHAYRQNVGNPPNATITNTTATGVQYDQYHQSELMSYLGYNTQGGFNVFSRVPTMDGDGNTDAHVLANDPTDYDHFANDPNIGPSNINYVTGTGAADQIAITNNGDGTANVSVSAFADATYSTPIDVPGATGNTYSYTISLDRPLTIDAGGRNDRVTLDGDLGVTITLRGMQGTDSLVVNGKGATNATYTTGTNTANGLDGQPDQRGTVAVSAAGYSTVIDFQEFEFQSQVTVSNVGTLKYVTGGSLDSIVLDTPTPGQMRLDGTSDGQNLIPLLFSSVGALVVDTGANDGALANDTVRLASPALAGLNSIAVKTGAGDDLLDVDFAAGNPVGAGGLSYDGGTGTGDRLRLRGGTFGTVTYTPSGPSSGAIVLDSTNVAYSNLAPVDDLTAATTLIVNGTAAADQINVADGPSVLGTATTQIRSGNGTFERVNFANKTDVLVQGQGGADAFNVTATLAAPGQATLSLFGDDAANLGDDAAADSFKFSTLQAGVAARAAGGDGGDTFTSLNTVAGAGSTLVLDGQNGGDGFSLTASAVSPITVTGGLGNDTLAFDGNATDYDVADTAITSAGLKTVTYGTVERLALTDGTFEVVGVVTTPIHVNNLATLYGTGTAAGGVTVNAGGTASPGVTAPSPAPGVLNTGDLAFTGGTYAVQLNGTGPGQHDELNVTGTVNLGTAATLAATVGYASLPGDEIVIVRNDGTDAVNGFFAGLPQGEVVAFGGVKFTIDYGYDADGDAAFNDVALVRYGAQLGPDPCFPGDPTRQALYVSATAAADVVELVGANGSSNVRVRINGVDEGTFRPSNGSPGIVFGQNGNDLITTAGIPSRAAMLYGNAGNDALTSGNGDAILVGGFGDDVLTSANGKDLLVGGAGADTADGGDGSGLLIAGATAFDANTPANRTALCQALDGWGRNGGAAVNALVAAAVAAGPDASVDRLIGGNGKDTFVANLLGAGPHDLLTDLAKNETVIEV